MLTGAQRTGEDDPLVAAEIVYFGVEAGLRPEQVEEILEEFRQWRTVSSRRSSGPSDGQLVDVEPIVRSRAAEKGIDPDEAIVEARRILQSAEAVRENIRRCLGNIWNADGRS